MRRADRLVLRRFSSRLPEARAPLLSVSELVAAVAVVASPPSDLDTDLDTVLGLGSELVRVNSDEAGGGAVFAAESCVAAIDKGSVAVGLGAGLAVDFGAAPAELAAPVVAPECAYASIVLGGSGDCARCVCTSGPSVP